MAATFRHFFGSSALWRMYWDPVASEWGFRSFRWRWDILIE
ncbi:Protein of unknown function [Pyronema omphalodes CBS 100304]|uniref:Uncharacterized protein n=1 Tax=Pyronema omphalodes (strain CBS 100304) TaxID=1076935 RepID=U4LCL8_PYROM|nr:Protein of unknown function [Pyronema omphalodes CBS 100304]